MTRQTDSKTPVVRQMLRRGAVLAAVFGVGAFAVLLFLIRRILRGGRDRRGAGK